MIGPAKWDLPNRKRPDRSSRRSVRPSFCASDPSASISTAKQCEAPARPNLRKDLFPAGQSLTTITRTAAP